MWILAQTRFWTNNIGYFQVMLQYKKALGDKKIGNSYETKTSSTSSCRLNVESECSGNSGE